jgi:hypothetical protein
MERLSRIGIAFILTVANQNDRRNLQDEAAQLRWRTQNSLGNSVGRLGTSVAMQGLGRDCTQTAAALARFRVAAGTRLPYFGPMP